MNAQVINTLFNQIDDDDDEAVEEEVRKLNEAKDASQETSDSGLPGSNASSAEHIPLNPGGGDVVEQEHMAFNSDLRSYLPKPMPSVLGTVELVKSLKAFYMLTWSRQLFRELFAITDIKIQDYSPNENQKVWDKPVHRRNVSYNDYQCVHNAS